MGSPAVPTTGNSSADAQLAEAQQALDTGKRSRALEAAQKAIALAPGDSRGYAVAGLALAALDRAPEAIVQLRKSLSIDDSDLSLSVSLARLLARQGEREEALALLNFVLLDDHGTAELRQEADVLQDFIRGAHAEGRP